MKQDPHVKLNLRWPDDSCIQRQEEDFDVQVIVYRDKFI